MTSPVPWKLLNPRQWTQATIPIALGAVVLVGGGAVLLRSRAAETPAPVVTPLPSPTVVTALGQLEPAGEVITLAAPSSSTDSRIARLLVEEGDRVRAGQVVAILDEAERLAAAVERADRQVDSAEAALDRVRAGAKRGELNAQSAEIDRVRAQRDGDWRSQRATLDRLLAERDTQLAAQRATIARLEAELANAQVEADRYASLYGTGAISASQRDSKTTTLDTARARLVEARANLAQIDASYREKVVEAQASLDRIRTTGVAQLTAARATLDRIAEVRPTDLRVAEADLAAAIAAAKQARADLNRAIIRAPRDSQVLKIYARPGELVGSQGIADLGQTQLMEVVAEVYDTDAPKVRVGQTATITSDAFSGELRGSVVRSGLQVRKQTTRDIDPSANLDERVVEVRIRLEPTDGQRVANLTNLQVKATIDLKSLPQP
ncbi:MULTISPECIES: HlyD family efflux transporter periplasmic adaptor subunit [Limnothrix]|uniref:HlyD family efflux transporter periplasmic adaptor subunit n=1 Tax=Limnothrix redekei LRLZ20PSL1 TaxID=3112953 RepID=A0ABW7C8G3_9CYAN